MTDSAAITLAERYARVNRQLDEACLQADRPRDAVTLVAVSKTRSADEVAALAGLGQRDFGENYLQEAETKIATLAHLPLTWHFIGPIQSNKTRTIASLFQWVHSVDRVKIARRLSEQRPQGLPPLNICLQVNIDREDSKSGFLPEDVGAAAAEIATLPNLALRGLMAIPSANSDDRNARAFHDLAMTLSSLRNTMPSLNTPDTPPLDSLSMGMSDDFNVAIREGATHVRIGTALFGPRPARDAQTQQ